MKSLKEWEKIIKIILKKIKTCEVSGEDVFSPLKI